MRPIHAGLSLLRFDIVPKSYNLENYHGPYLKLMPHRLPYCYPHRQVITY